MVFVFVPANCRNFLSLFKHYKGGPVHAGMHYTIRIKSYIIHTFACFAGILGRIIIKGLYFTYVEQTSWANQLSKKKVNRKAHLQI